MLGSHLTGKCFKVGRDQRGLPVDKIVRFRIVLARATVARCEEFQEFDSRSTEGAADALQTV